MLLLDVRRNVDQLVLPVGRLRLGAGHAQQWLGGAGAGRDQRLLGVVRCIDDWQLAVILETAQPVMD